LEHGSFDGTDCSASIRARFEELHINPIYSQLLIVVLEALLLQGRLRLLMGGSLGANRDQHPPA
jgi:hypothetical protein